MTTDTTTTVARPAPDRPIPQQTWSTMLVPLDGSSYSEAILGTVDRLARPLGARVTLLLVGDPQLDPTTPLPGAGTRARQRRRPGRGAAPVASGTEATTMPLYLTQFAYTAATWAASPSVSVAASVRCTVHADAFLVPLKEDVP